MGNENYVRINKFLSEAGYCSRREADRLIAEGRVKVNDKVPEMGAKIGPEDRVSVDGKPVVKEDSEFTYLAFNKPVGVVCTTTDPKETNTIISFIGYHKRIFPIGRLDKYSEGLILLTDDGEIVNKILRARNRHEKEYRVIVDRPITDGFLKQMQSGVPILNTVTRKCTVRKLGEREFEIILTQGLNRQIRRMCEQLGYRVIKLRRERIMNIRLDLPEGKWRLLTDREIKQLRLLLDQKKSNHKFGPQ